MTIYPLVVLFLCCFTSVLSACHPSPYCFSLLFSPCYVICLFSLFYPTFFPPFPPHFFVQIFPVSHPPLLNFSSLSASHLSLTSFCLISFPYPYLFTHFPFLYRSLLTYNSGQCSPSILAQAGGRWLSPLSHTCIHTCMLKCVHTQTCWGWWLMSNARLTASMPIRAAQETSLGLLAAAWQWRQYLPACLLHSGKNLKSCGYTLLNFDNHK